MIISFALINLTNKQIYNELSAIQVALNVP